MNKFKYLLSQPNPQKPEVIKCETNISLICRLFFGFICEVSHPLIIFSIRHLKYKSKIENDESWFN